MSDTKNGNDTLPIRDLEPARAAARTHEQARDAGVRVRQRIAGGKIEFLGDDASDDVFRQQMRDASAAWHAQRAERLACTASASVSELEEEAANPQSEPVFDNPFEHARDAVSTDGRAEVRARAKPVRPRSDGIGDFSDTALRAGSGVVSEWVGSFASWVLRSPAVGTALAGEQGNGARTFSGVNVRLEELFPSDVVEHSVGWARGVLSVAAVQGEHGRISAIRATIGVNGGASAGNPIIVQIGSYGRPKVTLELTPARPSALCGALDLPGNLEELSVVVSLGRHR